MIFQHIVIRGSIGILVYLDSGSVTLPVFLFFVNSQVIYFSVKLQEYQNMNFIQALEMSPLVSVPVTEYLVLQKI